MTEPAPSRRAEVIRHVVLGLIIALPLILTALMLQRMGRSPQNPIRKLSLDALYAMSGSAIEIIVFVLALVSGFRPIKMLARQPFAVGLSVLALLLTAFGTARFVAVEPDTAILMSGMWVVHLLFGLSVGWFAQEFWIRNSVRIWAAFVIALVAYAAVVTIYVALIKDPATYDWETLGVGVFNARAIIFYLTPGYFAALALSIFSPHKKSALVAAILILALTFWSGARSAAVAYVFIPVFALAVLPALRSRQFLVPFALSVALGSALSLIHHPPHGGYGVFWRVANEEREVSDGRFEIWQAAAARISERPIFGHGDQRMTVSVPGAINIHPHNSLLQIALQWGLVGMTLFFGLVGWLWLRIYQNVRRDTARYLPAFLVVTGMLFISLLDGALFWPHPIMVLAFAAAMGLATPREV